MFLIFISLFGCTIGKTNSESPNQTRPASDSGDSGIIDMGAVQDERVSNIDPLSLPSGPNPCREPMLLRVNHVVDGDTLYGTGDNGEEKVRVIGINAPELGYGGDASDCYADEALAQARILINSRLVWLTFDGQCEDGYGRTLAYVHFDQGEQGFFERVMLQGGFAKAYPFDNTDSFEAVFAEDEGQAENAAVGGWGACGWN